MHPIGTGTDEERKRSPNRLAGFALCAQQPLRIGGSNHLLDGSEGASTEVRPERTFASRRCWKASVLSQKPAVHVQECLDPACPHRPKAPAIVWTTTNATSQSPRARDPHEATIMLSAEMSEPPFEQAVVRRGS